MQWERLGGSYHATIARRSDISGVFNRSSGASYNHLASRTASLPPCAPVGAWLVGHVRPFLVGSSSDATHVNASCD